MIEDLLILNSLNTNHQTKPIYQQHRTLTVKSDSRQTGLCLRLWWLWLDINKSRNFQKPNLNLHNSFSEKTIQQFSDKKINCTVRAVWNTFSYNRWSFNIHSAVNIHQKQGRILAISEISVQNHSRLHTECVFWLWKNARREHWNGGKRKADLETLFFKTQVMREKRLETRTQRSKISVVTQKQLKSAFCGEWSSYYLLLLG